MTCAHGDRGESSKRVGLAHRIFGLPSAKLSVTADSAPAPARPRLPEEPKRASPDHAGDSWAYLHRAIDRDGDLVDTMLRGRRGMAAARAFSRSARSATGRAPDRVTTDRHGSYPRAIRSTLSRRTVHRTSARKDNGLEQDHRGVKGRTRCMREFKSSASAERFCRSHYELRNFLRLCTRHNQHVPASRRRLLHLRRAAAALAVLVAA